MPRPTRASLMALPGRINARIPGSMKSGGKLAKRPLIMGGTAFVAGSGLMRRRKSGLDKTPGRPTGMYDY